MAKGPVPIRWPDSTKRVLEPAQETAFHGNRLQHSALGYRTLSDRLCAPAKSVNVDLSEIRAQSLDIQTLIDEMRTDLRFSFHPMLPNDPLPTRLQIRRFKLVQGRIGASGLAVELRPRKYLLPLPTD